MPASITAKVWVLAWVSTPMTYAKEFATIVMVTLILSLWVDVTTGVDPGKSLRGRPVISHGHHKWSDKLLIKPSQWTGSAPVPTGPDRSWARHSKPIAEGQTLHESQPNRAPTPTLPANPRSATQRLTSASTRFRVLHEVEADRAEISPVLKFILDHDRVRGLTEQFEQLAKGATPAAPTDGESLLCLHRAAATGYPFTAPRIRPATNCLPKKTTKIMTGINASIALAVNGPHCLPSTLIKLYTETCTGRYSAELTMTEPATNSFHEPMNTNNAAAAILGRQRGKMIDQNVRKREAPSMVADSSSSCGMPSIAPLRIQMAIGKL